MCALFYYILNRRLNDEVIKASDYGKELRELALVCALCNDSSVVYNEVSKSLGGLVANLVCTFPSLLSLSFTPSRNPRKSSYVHTPLD